MVKSMQWQEILEFKANKRDKKNLLKGRVKVNTPTGL